jgi:hypothetical protein
MNKNVKLLEQIDIFLEQNDELESKLVPEEKALYISKMKCLLDAVKDNLIDFVNIRDKYHIKK